MKVPLDPDECWAYNVEVRSGGTWPKRKTNCVLCNNGSVSHKSLAKPVLALPSIKMVMDGKQFQLCEELIAETELRSVRQKSYCIL
ncbi:hypothetical protein NDU88_006977 [Pleurodeles waltl]|uniref:Uncharacterized protein n=1 Tax=Pleurodeles waltl TaxID=8319 RepID=A0AAV7RQH9_PLEWA|nr:hypothetical protein NDU88_006977 [Pleurodeles waltl]